jgi:hypothetical protein
MSGPVNGFHLLVIGVGLLLVLWLANRYGWGGSLGDPDDGTVSLGWRSDYEQGRNYLRRTEVGEGFWVDEEGQVRVAKVRTMTARPQDGDPKRYTQPFGGA